MRRFPRPAGLAVALLLVAGCKLDSGPEPTAIVPDHGPADAPVRVVIRGRGLEPAVTTDFTVAGEARLDARFTLRLGATALRDVQLRQDGALEALVPPGLAPGAHDLSVVRPDGRRGTLGAAYRALAPGAGDDVVAAFHVEVPGEATAGTPFAITVTALDAQGAPAADFGGAVELADRTGTVVPRRPALFDRGRWSGAVEVRSPSPADILTARVPGGASGDSASFAVRAAPATALVFPGPAIQVTAGACSGTVSLALLDRFGQPTAASAPVVLALAAPPGLALFADDACGVPLAGATLQPFELALGFHLRAAVAGPFTLGATAAGLGGATFTGEVLPASAAKLVLLAPASAIAGECTPAAVEVQDALGNATRALDVAVMLDAAPRAGLAFFEDASCAVQLTAARPGTDGRAWFAFMGSVAWPVTLTAEAPGLPPVAQAVTVAPGAVDRISFVSPPRTAQAGRCSPALTLLAQDVFGNAAGPSQPIALTLAVAPAGPAFFADPGCSIALGATAALASGSGALDVYLLAPAAGRFTVDASAPPLGGGAQDVEVLP
ncbi:MAG TPA: hypothetical protein VEM76_10040 [Anaeromyxobacteraceae bacterium]|nr:hypothetical protein [Anaeromyxobacteraceae bacterium]